MKRLIVLSVAVTLLAGCSAAENVVAAADDLVEDSVFSLAPGDCFNDPENDVSEVYTVDDTSCDGPHDNEVFALFNLPDGSFPGEEQVLTQGQQGCIDRFTSYVGSDYYESDLEVFTLTPTSESWAEGDREIVCVAYALDLSQLAGSVQGTGR